MIDSEKEIARINDHPVWGFMYASYDTKIGLDWDHPLARNVFVGANEELVPGKPAFYELPSTYPVTIVPARYGGIYEGGQWLAFPCRPDVLRAKCPSWDDSDLECTEFWNAVRTEPAKWIIGRAADPENAYYDLIVRIKEAADELDREDG